ncbi:DNA-binding response regulator [Flagellimonas sp. DF-77]|uniref:DNA-binding response regulator n=1 Tax=Flagellimonas algarum TaxID=3230298 RepID=UPI00339ABFBF
MFKKVLLAEDFQGENHGIVEQLRDKLKIGALQEEYYCDKAHTRLKVALKEGAPYELLITDLNFVPDHTDRNVTSGYELIAVARALQPDLKVVVYSVEDNPVNIDTLFKEQQINAYVCKGRHSLNELIKAVQEVFHNRTYFSPKINLNANENVFELDAFDLDILKDLANGLTKKEISEKLKKQNISPNSESTIDKKVSRLFDEFEAKNTNHLIAKLIKLGKI